MPPHHLVYLKVVRYISWTRVCGQNLDRLIKSDAQILNFIRK